MPDEYLAALKATVDPRADHRERPDGEMPDSMSGPCRNAAVVR